MTPETSSSQPGFCPPRGVALVTGAAGNIGPSVCAVLRRYGWKVVATDRSENDFRVYEKISGGYVEADSVIVADLDCQAACEMLVNEVEKTHGPVGLLVNNAALSQGEAFGKLTQAGLDKHWSVNVTSPLFLIQAAMEGLQQMRGTVINVSSIHVTRYICGNLGYTITKAALEAASSAVAIELAERGIRVNALRLGSVPGPAFLREFATNLSPEQAHEMAVAIMPSHLEARRAWSASREVCRAGEVGEVIAFLASPLAKSFIGATITLDAGLEHHFSMPSGEKDWHPKKEARRWLEEKGWPSGSEPGVGGGS